MGAGITASGQVYYHLLRPADPSSQVYPLMTTWHNDKLCASLPACTGGSLSPLRLALGNAVPLSSPWKLIPELVCLLWELRNIINGPSSMCST